jgi:hypothetical protein
MKSSEGRAACVMSGRVTWRRVDHRRVDDWRLMAQGRYLQSRHLTLRTWWRYRDGWDHDHCEFCQRHISVPLALDDPDAAERGYVTDDDYHCANGASPTSARCSAGL